MPEFTLNITGQANITKLADRAYLKIATTASGTNKQEVSDHVLTTAEHIDGMLGEIQRRSEKASAEEKPLSHFSKTSLTSNSWIEYVHQTSTLKVSNNNSSIFGSSGLSGLQQSNEPPQQVRHYRARIDFDIRFRDFTALGEFSTRITSLDYCEIQSLNWVMLPATQDSYKTELRLAAARDAMSKVKDYCQVILGNDCIVVPVTLVGESQSGVFQTGHTWPTSFNVSSGGGLFGGNANQSSSVGAATSHAHPVGAAVDQNLSFTPQEISMSLSVDLVFMIKTPGRMLSQYDL